jgi:tRNA dimethylallyltransferase
VIRALEVIARTGTPLSACGRRVPPDFDWLAIGLDVQRQELYRRIDARVEAMFVEGLVEEVRALNERGYGCNLPSMASMGYREVCRYLRGEIALEQAVRRTKTETHRLARMQHAWFRRDDARIHWLDVSAGDVFGRALSIVESWLSQ